MSKGYTRGNEALESNRDPNMTHNEHVFAICCRPEATGDIISGENVTTIEGYAVLNFEVASLSSFRDIQNKVITTMVIRSLDDPT